MVMHTTLNRGDIGSNPIEGTKYTLIVQWTGHEATNLKM